MAVNLTPNSESEPAHDEGADGLLQKSRLQYDRADKAALERERIGRVTHPLAGRRTREAGATGAVAYATRPKFEQAVERMQSYLRSGKISLSALKAENDADEARLSGWSAVNPRPGTPGHDRFTALKTRVAIRAAVLDRESALAPPLPPTTPVEMREMNTCHDPQTGKFCAGDSARFSGQSADQRFTGDTDVTIVDPHSNRARITHSTGKGKKRRDYEGAAAHLPLATVKTARGFTFSAHHHSLRKR